MKVVLSNNGCSPVLREIIKMIVTRELIYMQVLVLKVAMTTET